MIKDTRQDFITSENEDIRVECTHWAGHKYFTVTLMQFSYNCVCCGVALIQFTNSFENSNLWQSSTTNLVKEKQPRQIRTISAVRDFRASVCVRVVRRILKCNSFCKTREWFFLSLWKPSVRIFNTWPHQNPNHIRETERGVRDRVWGRNGGEGREAEKMGRVAKARPHQTTRPISERRMREAQDSNSSPSTSRFSFSFGDFFIYFMARNFCFSSPAVLQTPSASPPVTGFLLFTLSIYIPSPERSGKVWSKFSLNFNKQTKGRESLVFEMLMPAKQNFSLCLININVHYKVRNWSLNSNFRTSFPLIKEFSFHIPVIFGPCCHHSHGRIMATLIWVIPPLKRPLFLSFFLFLPSHP